METFLNNIYTLSSEIRVTAERLDEKSIWLFLATLACWSVSEPPIRIFAMVVVIAYLILYVFDGNFSGKSYKSRIKKIECDVKASEITESEKEHLMNALDTYCRKPLSTKVFIKKNLKYLIAAVFFGISFAHFLEAI